MKGGRACRPLVAAKGLSTAFIEPALARLASYNVSVRFERRLTASVFLRGRVTELAFGTETIAVSPADLIVLAVPATVAQRWCRICRRRRASAPSSTPITRSPLRQCAGANGRDQWACEWLFAFPDRLSVTISGADRLIDMPREELAEKIWRDVSQVTQIAQPLPAWQIIKEKRATFAATPQEESRRPQTRTAFANLLLAGDWTATGLPATIEGAIRSGFKAADEVLRPAGNPKE